MGLSTPHIAVQGLTVAFGSTVVLRDLSFKVNRGSIFIVMGGSGCGKSTLLRAMVGLLPPAEGQVFYDGLSFLSMDSEAQSEILKRVGVLYQGNALWSSLSLAENISLPLHHYTALAPEQIDEIVSLKLSLVGLSGFEDYLPSDISGGMKKRAALARAMALDPEILFLDEPSAGLDPISAHLLDELIVDLRDALGVTVVVVTHELDSILAIGDDSVFLDADTGTIAASGNPGNLLTESRSPKVKDFLTRGGRRAAKIECDRHPDGGQNP